MCSLYTCPNFGEHLFLEYKAKNAYMIEYLGPNGSNVNEFVFRIKNGFDEFKGGQTVRVTASGVTLAAAPVAEKSFFARAGEAVLDFFSVSAAYAADFSQTYASDSQGKFIVRINSSFAGLVTLHVQAGDNAQSFTVNVVANTPSITTSSLPDATVNSPYRQSFASIGGTAPYTYAVTSGTLPADLTLSSDGTLAGTPTATGMSTFTVTVTDANNVTASKQFSLTAGAAALAIDTSSLPDATVNSPYRQSLASIGGTAPYTYAVTSGTLPANLTLSSDGTLSGTPTATGVSTFTVTVTDANNVTASKQFSLTVNAATYTVSVSLPASIEAWDSATFTAMITKNSAQVPDNETVTWTVESGNGRFTSGTGSDTSRTSTTGGGQATISLQGTAAGTVAVKASIGGASGQANVTVNAATYSISIINPPSGAQTAPVLLTAQVVNSTGAAAEDVSVSWSYRNIQGGTSATLPNTITATDGTASQTAPYTSGERRTVTVAATVQRTSATANVQFGDNLPVGFVAYAGNSKAWVAAGEYCVGQGGQLPANQTYSYSGGTLPVGNYWSKSFNTLNAYFLIGDPQGLNGTTFATDKTSSLQVVCVP